MGGQQIASVGKVINTQMGALQFPARRRQLRDPAGRGLLFIIAAADQARRYKEGIVRAIINLFPFVPADPPTRKAFGGCGARSAESRKRRRKSGGPGPKKLDARLREHEAECEFDERRSAPPASTGSQRCSACSCCFLYGPMITIVVAVVPGGRQGRPDISE